MAKQRVIVVGGGPAGLMAAGVVAGKGIPTLVLEKKPAPARKLAITGKGRCNLTNTAPLEDFITHYGKRGRFLRQAYNRFFSDDLVAFLGELGLEIKSERGGRVFPVNEDAPAVAAALVQWAKNQGAEIRRNTAIDELLTDASGIVGVSAGGERVEASAVVLATGGLSYPATGSTGDGYRLAERVGHTIIPTRPALIPLVASGNLPKRLQGLSLRNVRATVLVNDKKRFDDFGEMLFTHFGLSGPIILSLSGRIVDALNNRDRVSISLDLKPALNADKLDARLLRDIKDHGKQHFRTLLKGLLPSKMIDVCVDQTAIRPDKPANQISADARHRLRDWLKDFRFEITGYRPIEEAIVTAGGIDLREINPRTMESKIVPGLYFAGELLDIDGETGGYNLQAAFSTGWLAGMSVAEVG